jgi:hopanoid biosynthesis associated RND transporter like protein HpnN
LTRVAEGLAAALDGEGRYKSPWPEMSAAAALGALDSTRLMTDDGRLGFVLLRLTPTDDQNLAQNSQAIDALRRVLAQAQSRHPRVKMGLTGLPIIENDEMRASQSSTIWATLLSFGGVFGVMVLGFGGFRHSAVVMVGLLVGTVWTCGAVAATVGHVTLLSAAFGSILFGLGIDYGIALLSGYLELRAGAAGPREALLDSATRFSPGITTAALTSAAAFFMVGLTEFTGVAQLGLIAGAGIMLCWLAMMTVMPALLTLVDRHQPAAAMPQPLELGGWLRPLLLRPRLAVAATIAFSALLALGIRGLWYDYNLLNLQPDGLESVALEHKLLNETNFSACFALSMADTPDELLARKQQFEELPTVERVEEIASLFPADAAAKSPLIARIQQRVARLPAQPPEIPVAPQAQIEQLLARAEGMLAIAPEGQAMVEQLRRVGELVRRTPPAEYLRRMTAYQQALAADLLARLQTLRAVSQPQPPALDDLPAGLTERFIGHSGKMVQKIYARINIWDVAGMEQFVREVRSVDENATGNPMQISEAARHMKRSYEQAAWYTLLGVIPIVLLDFRRLGHAMLAILPAVLALAQLMGLMGGLGMPFNPANMIVLPFLLGVGMDNGVHIVHDFRRQGAAYRQIDNSAALTVLINSLTTTVGFASLMVATHKGLQSLGQALTLGTSFCLLNALLLPNLLLLLNRRRKASGSTTADSATADADAAETSAPLQGEPDPAWPLAPGDDQVAAAYRRDAA